MRYLVAAALVLAAAPVAGAHPVGTYASFVPDDGARAPVGETVRFAFDAGVAESEARVEIAREETYDADGTLASSEDLQLTDGVADHAFEQPGRYVFLAVWRTAEGERQSETRTFEVTPRLSRRRARSTVRVAIAEKAKRRPRSLDLRCRRVDASTFRCVPSWIDRRYAYAGTMRVRRERGSVRYRFRGKRAKHSCTRRHADPAQGVRRCARTVRWRG